MVYLWRTRWLLSTDIIVYRTELEDVLSLPPDLTQCQLFPLLGKYRQTQTNETHRTVVRMLQQHETRYMRSRIFVCPRCRNEKQNRYVTKTRGIQERVAETKPTKWAKNEINRPRNGEFHYIVYTITKSVLWHLKLSLCLVKRWRRT
jgi:hypothetical protein